jgi:hypothetical protein
MAVYYLTVNEIRRVKIGVSQDPWGRLKSFEPWAPCELRLAAVAPGGAWTEQETHYRHRESRCHSEWFDLTPEIEDEIAQHSWAAEDPTDFVDYTYQRVCGRVYLRDWMEKNGLDIYGAAEIVGCSWSTISYHSRMRWPPSYSMAMRLDIGTGGAVPMCGWADWFGEPVDHHAKSINPDRHRFIPEAIERETGGAVPASQWADR